jgi:thiol-disulfide isomerase/thioredoxin
MIFLDVIYSEMIFSVKISKFFSSISRNQRVLSACVFILCLSVISSPAWSLELGSVAPEVAIKQLVLGVESEIQVQAPAQVGQKVLLEFFSINCSFCRENQPKVLEAEREAGSKAIIRFVGVDRSEEDLRAYAAANPNLHLVLDNQRVAKKAYEVRGTPTTYIVKDGKIVYRHEGVWEDSEKVKVRQILGN